MTEEANTEKESTDQHDEKILETHPERRTSDGGILTVFYHRTIDDSFSCRGFGYHSVYRQF